MMISQETPAIRGLGTGPNDPATIGPGFHFPSLSPLDWLAEGQRTLDGVAEGFSRLRSDVGKRL